MPGNGMHGRPVGLDLDLACLASRSTDPDVQTPESPLAQVGNDEADDAEEEEEQPQQQAPQQQQQQQQQSGGGGGGEEQEQQSFGGLTEAELAHILWDQASLLRLRTPGVAWWWGCGGSLVVVGWLPSQARTRGAGPQGMWGHLGKLLCGQLAGVLPVCLGR